jgi:hypothetical protein
LCAHIQLIRMAVVSHLLHINNYNMWLVTLKVKAKMDIEE